MRIRFLLDPALNYPVGPIHVDHFPNRPVPVLNETVMLNGVVDADGNPHRLYVHSVTPDYDDTHAWAYVIVVSDKPPVTHPVGSWVLARLEIVDPGIDPDGDYWVRFADDDASSSGFVRPSDIFGPAPAPEDLAIRRTR